MGQSARKSSLTGTASGTAATGDHRLAPASHTPGPWDFCRPGREWIIYPESARDDGIDYFIASTESREVGREVAKANAAFIVRACNAHDELVATLRRIALAKSDGIDHQRDVMVLERAIQAAKDVLAKVGATP